jgi:hypothetical protein
VKAVFPKLGWIALLLVVLLGGVALVVASILSTLNISVANLINQETVSTPEPDTEKSLVIEPVVKTPPPAKPDEVKSYNLFTTVVFGASEVTTGIKYGSSLDQKIKSQWCYLTEPTQQGQSYHTLSLAAIDANGTKTIPDFKNTALAKFGLSKTTVQALIKSHCRFQ